MELSPRITSYDAGAEWDGEALKLSIGYTKEIAVCGTWMTLQNALEKSLSSSHTFIQKARKGGRLRQRC